MDRNDEGLSRDAQHAREMMRAAPTPRADEAFRARLREDFVSGRIEELEAPRTRRDATHRGAHRAALRRWFAQPTTRIAFGASAVALAFLVLRTLNEGPQWAALPATGDLAVVVDGKLIAIRDRYALDASLRPGVDVRVPEGGEIVLVSEGTLALQLLPGAELTLPRPPPRWVKRTSEIDARAGEIRISTAPRFQGAHLTVRTPNAAIEVTGTTLAVILNAEGTCVCVLDGTVRMGPLDEAKVPVPAGMRRILFADGRPPHVEGLFDMERGKLTMFRDATFPAPTD